MIEKWEEMKMAKKGDDRIHVRIIKNIFKIIIERVE